MMRAEPTGETMRIIGVIAILSALASPLSAGEAGDLVFAERGPWQLRDAELNWQLTRTGPEGIPGFQPVSDGLVTLHEISGDVADAPELQLSEVTEARSRDIGPFPVSGGDAALTFFLENTARDMAAMTGGSPFYIRNRIKDALRSGGTVERQQGVTIATFRPFADDPNAARMGGFATLELRFTFDQPAAPIRQMLAQTGAAPLYHHEMALK